MALAGKNTINLRKGRENGRNFTSKRKGKEKIGGGKWKNEGRGREDLTRARVCKEPKSADFTDGD